MRVYVVEDLTGEGREAIQRALPGAEIHGFPSEEALAGYLAAGQGPKLHIQTFGNFEAFYQGELVHFRRSRTKELLAYLVDRRGAGITMGELISILWEGRPATDSVRSQLRSLITDLRLTLRPMGQEGVVVKHRDLIAIDPRRVDCDYYRFLAGDPGAVKAFRGEYMTNYSWAETTLGTLEQEKKK